MWSKKEHDKEGRLETMIGKDSSFQGVLRVVGGIRIDGSLEGDLEASGTLVVGKSGIMASETIRVQNAIIGGKVTGNILAADRVELQQGAHFKGDVECQRLLIDEDVFFEGNCKMTPSGGQEL